MEGIIEKRADLQHSIEDFGLTAQIAPANPESDPQTVVLNNTDPLSSIGYDNIVLIFFFFNYIYFIFI